MQRGTSWGHHGLACERGRGAHPLAAASRPAGGVSLACQTRVCGGGTLSRLSAHSHPRRGLFVLELFVLAVPPAVL